jgi:hypothetical protein
MALPHLTFSIKKYILELKFSLLIKKIVTMIIIIIIIIMTWPLRKGHNNYFGN